MKAIINNVSNNGNLSPIVREVVFGVEDGMVSTLGAMTGIAVGSGDKYTVLLAGIVIITVESVSMAIGSFISNKSSEEVTDKIIEDEKEELKKYPKKEEEELYSMFVRDGWGSKLAFQMTKHAIKKKKLLLTEHSYRELGVFPHRINKPSTNAIFMFFSYIIGGIVPLFSYLVFPITSAIYLSVILSLIGLFCMGSITTVFTKVNVYKAGFRIAVMGGFAFFVGLIVGELVSFFK
jgi:predicted membrane protein (TIGR00267 family)